MGHELNPRVGPLDLKFFCALRPGLIGWTIINWIFVYEGYTSGKLTPALVAVAAFQTLYVLDALYFEVGFDAQTKRQHTQAQIYHVS